MKRRIITIDTTRCNGCGICAEACHEGAIGMSDGKAILLRDDYCDGLGDCLPTCPTSAITFVEREALAFDKEAVEENMRKMGKGHLLDSKKDEGKPVPTSQVDEGTCAVSCLKHWPVQLQLVSERAEFLKGADLLIAADCCAYAMGDFHEKFMKNRVVLVGCPKLDCAEYSEKLGLIFQNNPISSVVVTRMEVPCCGGLEFAVKQACEKVGKEYDVVTLTVTGEIKSKEKNM